MQKAKFAEGGFEEEAPLPEVPLIHVDDDGDVMAYGEALDH